MNDKLQTGDYCEVTRDQAIELLKAEKFPTPIAYVDEYFYNAEYMNVWMRYDAVLGLIISGFFYSKLTNRFEFPDFKQRLINTVNK